MLKQNLFNYREITHNSPATCRVFFFVGAAACRYQHSEGKLSCLTDAPLDPIAPLPTPFWVGLHSTALSFSSLCPSFPPALHSSLSHPSPWSRQKSSLAKAAHFRAANAVDRGTPGCARLLAPPKRTPTRSAHLLASLNRRLPRAVLHAREATASEPSDSPAVLPYQRDNFLARWPFSYYLGIPRLLTLSLPVERCTSPKCPTLLRNGGSPRQTLPSIPALLQNRPRSRPSPSSTASSTSRSTARRRRHTAGTPSRRCAKSSPTA